MEGVGSWTTILVIALYFGLLVGVGAQSLKTRLLADEMPKD